MKQLIFLCTILSLEILRAQSFLNLTTFKNTSLDVTTDAASIALGESFVANSRNQFSFFENPAALPSDSGAKIFYNYRSNGWSKFTQNFNYFSIGATANSSIGRFGFSYKHFSTGPVPFSQIDKNQTTNDINQTFILSYSREVFNNLSAGFSAKMFNRSLTSSGGANYQINSTNTFLFDFGLIYGFDGFFNKATAQDKFNVGLSVQNFGTDYEEEYKYLFNETIKRRLPRYLRVGFAYELNLISGKNLRASFDLLFTGEYRNLLNAASIEKSNVDYWGGGIEAALFKIFSVRLGGVVSPENNILFDRAKINWRYGAGMQFPVAVLGLNYPLIIKFDFALIPVNKTSFENSRTSLPAFGVSFIYSGK